jgi:hypothetical protein
MLPLSSLLCYSGYTFQPNASPTAPMFGRFGIRAEKVPMASIRRGDFHCSGWKHRRSVAACEVAGLAQIQESGCAGGEA